jgi:hypothetical protein
MTTGGASTVIFINILCTEVDVALEYPAPFYEDFARMLKPEEVCHFAVILTVVYDEIRTLSLFD